MCTSRIRIAAIAAIAAAAVLVGVGSSAIAAGVVTVTGGTLSLSAAPTVGDFTGITLNGSTQSTTGTVGTFSVADARGSGAGWNVTVQGTQFAEHNGTAYVVNGKLLPTSSLTLSAPTVTAAAGTTSAVPTITAGGPYTIDAGTAVKIASAAVDTGMGTYNFSSTTMTVSVPASAYAKTYRSDVTVTLASTP